VDAAFMQLERHGWDIHAVSAEPNRPGPGITGHKNVRGTQEHQESRPAPPSRST
jgi:hypothetical protein